MTQRQTRRAFGVLVLLALSVIALSGCIDSGAIEDAYTDADRRYTDEIAGDHNRDHTFSVPAGTDRLRIAIRYEMAGEFMVEVNDPDGQEVAEIMDEGAADVDDDSWYVVDDPQPGTWQIEVNAEGAAEYAIGVYY